MTARSFDLKALVRPNIWALQPYRCARDDYSSGVLLDANENSYGPCVTVQPAIAELERYPDPLYLDIKELVGAVRKVKPENIFFGVGSDEAIDMAIRIFCQPGRDKVLICPPTYGMYKVAAATNDVGVVTVPLSPDFELCTPEILAAVSADAAIRIIFLCSPNNPTGNELKLDDIRAVIEGCADRIVVVDEAYIDFSARESLTAWVHQYPNLVVLQTMSKSFGLAGIRLGMAFASSDIIAVMNKVKAPYSINKFTAAVALQAFSPEGLTTMRAHVAQLVHEHAWLRERIGALPGVDKVWPSVANFFIFRVEDAYQIYKQLADDGVVIRYRGSEMHCGNALRVTVGTREQNEILLAKLSALLQQRQR